MASRIVSERVDALRSQVDSLEKETDQLRQDREQLIRVLDDTAERLRISQRALRKSEAILYGLPAHRLWRLLSECMQQQHDGNDVLASAAWDDVVACWTELEKAT